MCRDVVKTTSFISTAPGRSGALVQWIIIVTQIVTWKHCVFKIISKYAKIQHYVLNTTFQLCDMSWHLVANFSFPSVISIRDIKRFCHEITIVCSNKHIFRIKTENVAFLTNRDSLNQHHEPLLTVRHGWVITPHMDVITYLYPNICKSLSVKLPSERYNWTETHWTSETYQTRCT